MKPTTLFLTVLSVLLLVNATSAQVGLTYTFRPDTGDELITKSYSHVTGPHQLTVENNSGHDAIVKIEETWNDSTYRLVYVRRGATHTIEGIKDGTFQVKFALGSDYSAGNKMFLKPISFTQFDYPNSFVTRIEDTPTQIITHYQQLTVTLAPTVGGDAKTSKISAKDF